MLFDAERIYKLLPAMYRLRDAENKAAQEPLKALIEILAREVSVIEENMEQLYDDHFIETCAEWVVPYIGELVGARALINTPGAKFSQRAEVANTISYRRRKGTASILEQLARDITQWDSNVVEYFQLLATTQYLNHLRPNNLSVSGLKDWKLLELIDTPFDQNPRTADVRNINSKRGKYNIQNIGIFLWRIRSYTRKLSVAFKVDDFLYTFDPCGLDIPLYNHPVAEDQITQLAGPSNVPMPITRRFMRDDVSKYYSVSAADEDKISIQIGGTPIIEDLIVVCNLSDDTSSGSWRNIPVSDDQVIIDPVLGRIAFGADYMAALNSEKVIVRYNYGFTADMGGGEYNRLDSFELKEDVEIFNVPGDFPTIPDALTAIGTSSGVIEITDNRNYPDDININIAQDQYIEIRAGEGFRPLLNLSDNITITADTNTALVLNGLLIDGGNIEVPDTSKLDHLTISHCTLKPSDTQNIIDIQSNDTKLVIAKSIVAGIQLANGANAELHDSIVDVVDSEKFAISDQNLLASGSLNIQNCSIMGRVFTERMDDASNTIFISLLEVVQLQKGCVRFSYFPQNSITPKSYKCQPELSGFKAHIYPSFTSTRFGDPGYFQLHKSVVKEISQGGDNDSEMGAFYHLFTTQKINNLRARLNEYLRFGMEAGIFFAS